MLLPSKPGRTRRAAFLLILTVLPVSALAIDQNENKKEKDRTKAGPAASTAAKVSYDKQVRPILQSHCQGCHQPAKAGGAFVMTSFERMLKGGESGEPAIVPSKPAESHLVELITPDGGKAEMPQNKPPLAESEIALIAQWIAQGAKDDTPQDLGRRYDAEHPPEYTRLPVIPALAFAPDGSLLAVAGFHEVLLWKADGTEPVGRLVGLSERIESLAFSPDGKKLAVTGGRPSRMGEVQVWDVARRKLSLSVSVTFDTVYGASWSPDGTKIAFGCTDNTVRAIDARTGEQVLFLGAHSDWAQDTVFSADGSHLISVGRDMAAKLTEMATQRFVDNITSITPGALKGGLATVARHPKRDEIVIGGSDGEPKLYRVFRRTSRVIGDDSNLIREFPPLPGRVYSVAISSDGKRIAAGSSLDGFSGEVGVYSYEFDTALPENIKAINEKVVTARSAAETAALDAYHKAGVKQISSVKVSSGRHLHGRVPARRQGPGGGRRRWHCPADRPGEGHHRQGVRAGSGHDLFGRGERAGHRGAAEARRSRRERGSSQGGSACGAGRPAPGDPVVEQVRLCSASGNGQARLGRDDRRNADGRAQTFGRYRRRHPFRPGPAQGRRQGDALPEPGRQVGRCGGGRTRAGHAGARRFRP